MNFIEFYTIIAMCYILESVAFYVASLILEDTKKQTLEDSVKYAFDTWLDLIVVYCKGIMWPYFIWKEHFKKD